MKLFSKFAFLFASLLFAVSAFGGNGSGGGGFGKTILLLQELNLEQATLSFEGAPSIPETGISPLLMIPEDEYLAFMEKVEEERTTKVPYVLIVDQADGTKREFILCHNGDPATEPVVLYLLEKTN